MHHVNDIPVGDEEFARIAVTAENWHNDPNVMFESIASLFTDVCEYIYDEPIGDQEDRRIQAIEIEAELYETAFTVYLVNAKRAVTVFPVELLRQLASWPGLNPSHEDLRLFQFHLGCLQALVLFETGEKPKKRPASPEQLKLVQESLSSGKINPWNISRRGLKIRLGKMSFGAPEMNDALRQLREKTPKPPKR